MNRNTAARPDKKHAGSRKCLKNPVLLLLAAVLLSGLLFAGCGKKDAGSVGIIGGADGPTAIYVAPGASDAQAPAEAADLAQAVQEAKSQAESEITDLAQAVQEAKAHAEVAADAAEAQAENAAQAIQETREQTVTAAEADLPDEDGVYTDKDDVALYLHTYGHLPQNFITKKEAQALGWTGGSLEPYAPGMCIGGDHFGNYEGKLPKKANYHECDIGTLGKKSRGAKRIIYSDDGKIYYTGDHYETFEQLY